MEIIKKMIVVESCLTCPLVKTCKCWTKLTGSQRISLTCGHGIPNEFILVGCPLDDLKEPIKEEDLDRLDFLTALEVAGVDNWGGFSQAHEILREWANESNNEM